SLLLSLSPSLTLNFPFYFFHATSPPLASFSFSSLNYFPSHLSPFPVHPPPDAAPGANNFSYIIRTWHTQWAPFFCHFMKRFLIM
ncbi:Uncharacterized protein FWK35_00020688, partial [Aphis craccivora]